MLRERVRDGVDGEDGESAYQIAQRAGFKGQESDWLKSLKGRDGLDGKDGEKGDIGPRGPRGYNGNDGRIGKAGEKGPKGKPGEKGEKGDPGPEGPPGKPPAHEWIETALRFKKPDGEWGKAVDLKGPPGSAGALISVPGSGDYQPLDSDLTAIAALSTTAFGRSLLEIADAEAGRDLLEVGAGGSWGDITGTLADQTDLQTALDGKQPVDSDLTAIAALTTTAFGRSFLDRVDAAAGRTLLELGTAAQSATGDFQAADAELAALAGLASAADKLPYFTGSGTAALADFTSVARTFLAQTSQAAMRSTGLGLGTAAVANTGTSGNTLPFLDGANTWSAQQTFQNVELRNGTTPTVLYVNNTWTDASNYERAFIGYSTYGLHIEAQNAGTGAARHMYLKAPAGVVFAEANQFRLMSDSVGTQTLSMTRIADGWLDLSDASGASFDRLSFGGTAGSHPALKRSGTALQCALANYTAFAPFQASSFILHTDVPLERDAANVHAWRNGVNPQTGRLYRSFTDAANYERMALQSGAGYFELAAETAGSGTDNIDLRLTPAGTGQVLISGVAALSEAKADAKGDLLVATAADAISRLAVGTDGHVLTADSAEATGVKWAPAGGGSLLERAPVRAVYQGGSLTLSGEQTVAGVALVSGDRVLLRAHSTPANAGIWVVSTGAWARPADADTFQELEQGTFVYCNSYEVTPGTYDETTWVQRSPLAPHSGEELDWQDWGLMASSQEAAAAQGNENEITDSSNSAGSSTWPAGRGHQHAHGNRGGGSLHALVVSSGAAGFMSGTDKANHDTLVTRDGIGGLTRGPASLPTSTTSVGASTTVLISGTSIAVPTGSLKVGTRLRFKVNMTKTAASTAAWQAHVKFGTNNTTADAAIASWTSGTNTAAIDQCMLHIDVQILTLGAAATARCFAWYVNTLTNATGFGVINPTPTSTATFNSGATNPFLHIDIQTGASAAYTAIGTAEVLA